jgi:hypothetical protein
MKIAIIAVCVSMIGGACIPVPPQNELSGTAYEATMLAYFKDPRTGLCFAGKDFGTRSAVLTNVPCSNAVENAISQRHGANVPTAQASKSLPPESGPSLAERGEPGRRQVEPPPAANIPSGNSASPTP